MADVTIDATLQSASHSRHYEAGPYFAGISNGYLIGVDSGADCAVWKTEDGGANWSVLVELDSSDTAGVALWHDKWTPGDTGDLLHCVWIETSDDVLHYRTIDTSDDSLGTERIVHTFTTVTGDIYREFSLYIIKTRGGKLKLAARVDDNGEHGFFESDDGGATWDEIATPFDDDADQIVLQPGNETDSDDMWGIYADRVNDHLDLKTFDDSAGTWSAVTISENWVDVTATLSDFHNIGAAVRHSDNKSAVAFWNAHDVSTADLEFFIVGGSADITQKTNVIDNLDEAAGVAVYINNQSGRIYVFYYKGNPTLDTSHEIKYKFSDDDGDNWSAEQDYSEDTPGIFLGLTCGQGAGDDGGRVMPCWVDDVENDYKTNTNNAITIEAAAGGAAFTETPFANVSARARPVLTSLYTVSLPVPASATTAVTPGAAMSLSPVTGAVASVSAAPSRGVTESPFAEVIANALSTQQLAYGLERTAPANALADVLPGHAGTLLPFANATALALITPGYSGTISPFASAVALAILSIPAGQNFTEAATALANAFASLVQLFGVVQAPSSNAAAVITLVPASAMTLERPVPADAFAGIIPGYAGTLSPSANATAFANAQAGQAVILSVFANAVAVASLAIAYDGTLSRPANTNAFAGVTPGYAGTISPLTNAIAFALVIASQPITIRPTALVRGTARPDLVTAFTLSPEANVTSELAAAIGLTATLIPSATVISAIGIGVARITQTASGLAVVSVSAEVTPSALELVTLRLTSLQLQVDQLKSRIGSVEDRDVEWEI
jgi:hypothetical protein